MEKKYKTIWSPFASNQLKKIGYSIAERIAKKVEDYLALNPTQLCKLLSHQENNIYSYRFGDWRIVYQINKTEILILITNIEHRRNIYQQLV